MKVLAVASGGGHWEQLIRTAKPLEKTFSMVYVCTHEVRAVSVDGHPFYKINDFNRSNCFKIISVCIQALRLILKERPDAVITTGAAPGLVMVFIASCLRIKTIWIDSLANVQHLSLSGRIASLFVSRIYTQWETLATKKIKFAGNVFG